MIKGLLSRNPKQRLTVDKVLKHAWLKNVEENINIFNDGEKQLINKEFVYCDDDVENL